MAEINNGPNWLRGDYPMGLLKGVQERRRYVDPNGKLPSGWRELVGVDVGKGLDDDDDNKEDEEDEEELGGCGGGATATAVDDGLDVVVGVGKALGGG